ncbi:MAG TPA: hypothetical protein VEY91_12620 [Candidatus Limnocylindria bacterium]|nr:hypothetical protein [Candidatus Limnocylindria bacterium]
MSLRRRFISLVLLAAFALTGCSHLPTAPDTGDESHHAIEAGATATPPATKVTASARSSEVVFGALGGIVSAGDFTVIFPPLAFEGTATVTVSQPDLAAPIVDLQITPQSANNFRLPVLLLAEASRVDPKLLSIAHISYFNPTTGLWERVPGSTVNVLDLTVQAPLWHFSKYRVQCGSKAGW